MYVQKALLQSCSVTTVEEEGGGVLRSAEVKHSRPSASSHEAAEMTVSYK